jgi:hypothetical protein
MKFGLRIHPVDAASPGTPPSGPGRHRRSPNEAASPGGTIGVPMADASGPRWIPNREPVGD